MAKNQERLKKWIIRTNRQKNQSSKVCHSIFMHSRQFCSTKRWLSTVRKGVCKTSFPPLTDHVDDKNAVMVVISLFQLEKRRILCRKASNIVFILKVWIHWRMVTVMKWQQWHSFCFGKYRQRKEKFESNRYEDDDSFDWLTAFQTC